MNVCKLDTATNSHNESRGYSLVELMIAISINTIVISLLALVWNSVGKFIHREESKSIFIQESRIAFGLIEKNLAMCNQEKSWNEHRICTLGPDKNICIEEEDSLLFIKDMNLLETETETETGVPNKDKMQVLDSNIRVQFQIRRKSLGSYALFDVSLITNDSKKGWKANFNSVHFFQENKNELDANSVQQANSGPLWPW